MQKILADLKAGKIAPVYFLHGGEPYFIDKISDFIEEKLLNEGEKAFNQMVLYGKEIQAQQVIDACMQFPMMASHRVVIVKEAQEMRSLKDLEGYIEKPCPTAILCICYKHKKLDSRTKFGKAIAKNAVLFESKKMYDNQLPGYVSSTIKARKRLIDAQSANLIAEYIGSDLSTLHNELEKLYLAIPSGGSITMDVVQKQIGISKDYNVFELQSAIAARNSIKAFRIAMYFQDNPKKNPMIKVVATLYRFFSKVWVVAQNGGMNDQVLGKQIGVYNSFFMKEYRLAAQNYSAYNIEGIFQVLKEYDLKSKGVDNRSFPDNQLMVELVARVMR